jgi:hypothetical protein
MDFSYTTNLNHIKNCFFLVLDKLFYFHIVAFYSLLNDNISGRFPVIKQ